MSFLSVMYKAEEQEKGCFRMPGFGKGKERREFAVLQVFFLHLKLLTMLLMNGMWSRIIPVCTDKD